MLQRPWVPDSNADFTLEISAAPLSINTRFVFLFDAFLEGLCFSVYGCNINESLYPQTGGNLSFQRLGVCLLR